MINPFDVTNFNRNDEELQEFLIFCLFVAGKNALQTAGKVDSFVKSIPVKRNGGRSSLK